MAGDGVVTLQGLAERFDGGVGVHGGGWLGVGEHVAECCAGGGKSLPLAIDLGEAGKEGVRDLQGGLESLGGTVGITDGTRDLSGLFTPASDKS